MTIYDADNNVLLDVTVDDTSLRSKALNGDNTLTLNYSLAEHVEVPIGAWCVFKGERYSLMSPEDITMNHRRSFEYALTMHSEDAKAKLYKFVNPVDGRLKFTLTAKPREHLQMLVDNLNMRDSGWTTGECPDLPETVLSYNHTTCHDALVQLADELELDYWFTGKSVSIGKLELNKDNPLPLSYGGDGAGLKPGIRRNNYSEALPVEILYTQGSETNIDRSKYGASELHLPKSQGIRYDGEKFEDEAGFDETLARAYVTDANGYSVRRSDKGLSTHCEDSLDCSEITPAKEEAVASVVEADAEKHFWDVVFSSPVDYGQYQIAGETPSVIFQTGMLAGKEFNLATYTSGTKKDTLKCERQEDGGWLVELCPAEIDGITMPDKDSGYVPAQGDKFKVFGIQLPDEYICDNGTRSGAEWDMLRHAVRYMHEHEEQRYTVTGELDEIYAKRNWESISDRLVLGGYISFTDRSWQADPLLIRIVGIKEYVNRPYSPTIEISNAPASGTLSGALSQLENRDALNEDRYRRSVGYTKRRWRDLKETTELLEAAFDNFSGSVSPVAVQTMQMIVGDEMLQFIFTKSLTDDTQVEFAYSYDAPTGIVTIPQESFIKHMTLGITSISSAREESAYKRWSLPPASCALEQDKSYYIYAKVSKSATSGTFVFSEEPFSETDEHYYLLVGILNSEYEGARSFVSLHGFTEILPARITTDKVVSADGETYFDLVNGVIGGRIKFAPGSSGLENVDGWKDLQDQIDGAIETWYAAGAPTLDNHPASGWTDDAERNNHVGDIYYDKDTGKAYRFMLDEAGTYLWTPIADNDIAEALRMAKDALDKAGGAITGVDVEYATSDSPTVPPEDGWQTQAPERMDKAYLWQRTRTAYSDGTETLSDPVCISGADGVGIVSVTELYCLSSGTGRPDAPSEEVTESRKVKDAWTKTCPDWENGCTYWTCSQIIREDGAVVFTDVTEAGNIKNRVFVTADGEHPLPPYNTGDLWLCAHYAETAAEAGIVQTEDSTAVTDEDGDGNPVTVSDANTVEYTNEILKCVNAKATGEEFSINDWQPAAGYAKASDYDYLRAALPETATVIDGGLALGTFLGVTDAASGSAADGNVVAGMCGVRGNGDEFWDEDRQSKLLLFAGTDADADANVKYKSAKTQIWDDGTLKSTKGELEGLTVNSSRNPFINYGPAVTGGSRDISGHDHGLAEGLVAFPWGAENSGRRILLAGAGFYAEAPDGKHFYEDGRELERIYCYEEIVEFVGVGTDEEFMGWSVLSRAPYGRGSKAGRPLNTLLAGRCTGSSTGVSMEASGCALANDDPFDLSGDNTAGVSRAGKGVYRMTLPGWWFATETDIFVSLTGCGAIYGGSNPVKATLYSISGSADEGWTLEIRTSDDETENDGSFFFEIKTLGNWYVRRTK